MSGMPSLRNLAERIRETGQDEFTAALEQLRESYANVDSARIDITAALDTLGGMSTMAESDMMVKEALAGVDELERRMARVRKDLGRLEGQPEMSGRRTAWVI